MKRRDFITLLGSAAAWPLWAHAQQGERIRRVGVLMGGDNDSAGQADFAAFRESLLKLGWTEGRNIRIDHRFGASDTTRFQAYAVELVGLAPDVILGGTSPVLRALLQRPQTIPIVFFNVSDPVVNGFVTSLARPGGNVTGFANNEFSMSGKWLELLKDVAPKVSRVMVVLDPENPTWRGFFRTLETVAPALGMQVVATPVVDAAGIEHAIGDFGCEPNGGLVVLPGPATTSTSSQALIVGLAASHHLRAIYSDSDTV